MKLLRAQVCVVLFLCASAPMMGATRVFVSGAGMDTGACPITAPCRSFSYALTQVAASGEVIALDTAGYGVANITQSVTLVAAPGATAFIAASSGTAITIVAGATDVVTLRGLALTSTGASDGVAFYSGLATNVENSIINGFSIGVDFPLTGNNTKPRLQVLNTMFRNNFYGINVANYGAGSPGGGPPPNIAYVTVAGSYFIGNTLRGIVALDNSRVAVSDSVFAANGTGVQAQATADYSFSEVNLERCIFSRNGIGVIGGDLSGSQLPHGVIRIANCMITGNDTGVVTTANGATLSRISNAVYTNTIEGNGVDGTPSSSYNAK